MSEGFYKKIFLIGALWNVAGGAVIVLLTSQIFAAAHLTPPDPWVYYYSWIALFVTFGIGYYLVYRDMYGNKNIVILGIIGKLGFATIFLAGLAVEPGQVPSFFLIPVLGDLVFVVLYGKFLNFARRTGN
jgi:peptidoglycan/LPS O-acetylase OafA/YrhL